MNIRSTTQGKPALANPKPLVGKEQSESDTDHGLDRFLPSEPNISKEMAVMAVVVGTMAGYMGPHLGSMGTAVGGLTGAAVLGSVGVGLGWRVGAFITDHCSGNEEPGGFAGMALGGVGGLVAGAVLGAKTGSVPAALAGATLGVAGSYFLSEFG